MHELCSNDEIYKHTYLLFPAVTHLCGKLSTKPKPRPNNIHEYCDVLSSSQPSCSLKRKKERKRTDTHTHAAYLVEIFTCGSHLLPGLVEQLDADTEEFFKSAIVGEEHGVEVMAVFTGCGHKKYRFLSTEEIALI